MAYSEKQIKELFEKICKRIIKGESLRSILRDKEMPSRPTFYNWIEKDEELINQYARATKARADNIFDEIIEIADSQENDIVETDEGQKVNWNVVQRNRLQIDARKWSLSKMNPKKYGEKVDITTDGEKINNDFYFTSDDFEE